MKLKSSLFFLYLLIWLLLAVQPSYRNDWVLENILVFIALPMIIWGRNGSVFQMQAHG